MSLIPDLTHSYIEILVPSVVVLGWGFGMYLDRKGGHNELIIFTTVLMHLLKRPQRAPWALCPVRTEREVGSLQ